MKIKTSTAEGEVLNWLVAKCVGVTCFDKWHSPYLEPNGEGRYPTVPFNPSTDWAQGGPIIDCESISVVCAVGDGIWSAYPCDKGPVHNPAQQVSTGSVGTTPLIAAMRCYVASKLGEEVEIPEELTSN